MEKSIIIISIVSVVAIIIFLIYYFNPKTIILRRLKKLRFSKIGSLQNHHYSKVEGNALNVNQPLIARLSKRFFCGTNWRKIAYFPKAKSQKLLRLFGFR